MGMTKKLKGRNAGRGWWAGRINNDLRGAEHQSRGRNLAGKGAAGVDRWLACPRCARPGQAADRRGQFCCFCRFSVNMDTVSASTGSARRGSGAGRQHTAAEPE